MESIGSAAHEPDDQEMEGMSASLNSEAGRGTGVQSASDHHAPVSGQEQNRVREGVSSRTRKQTVTTYLTGGH